MGRSYFYILLLILLGSCSKDLMTLRVTVPAPVFLYNEVQRIGIIDRSIPSEKNQTLDILDRVLSAEGKDFDKDATKKTLEGLFEFTIMSFQLCNAPAMFKCLMDKILGGFS